MTEAPVAPDRVKQFMELADEEDLQDAKR